MAFNKYELTFILKPIGFKFKLEAPLMAKLGPELKAKPGLVNLKLNLRLNV